MLKVILRRRVIVEDGVVFDAEREVSLPVAPFVGLRLYNTERVPEGCDESEDPIKEVACDLKTGRIFCYLPVADFRPESSGSQWAEEDVREEYLDWKLGRDHRVKPPSGGEKRSGNHG
jgi:hypothetical protein